MVQQNQLNLRIIWLISTVVIALMVGFSAWAWVQLPAGASIPVHWNAAGEVDRYGGKVEGLLVLPLVSGGVVLLFTLIRYIDPLRANIERSGKAYRAVLLGTLFFLAVLHVGAVLNAVGYAVNIGLLAAPAVGLMFIVIGNYLGKIRRNYMFGVRTPWTLTSELAWNKTHRVTGRLFVVVGLLVLIAIFWSSTIAFYTLIGGTVGILLFAMIYSYLVWKNDPAVQTAEKVL
jgi:uncharacterized membrane protein